MPKYKSIGGKWEKVRVEKNVNKPVSVQMKEKKEEVNLDLNNDGKVDKKDASIAGKVLNVTKKKRTYKKKTTSKKKSTNSKS